MTYKNKTFCLSGFGQEKEAVKQKLVEKYNVNFTETTTTKTDFLLVKELDLPYPTAKVKMAYSYNIPIINFKKLL